MKKTRSAMDRIRTDVYESVDKLIKSAEEGKLDPGIMPQFESFSSEVIDFDRLIYFINLTEKT